MPHLQAQCEETRTLPRSSFAKVSRGESRCRQHSPLSKRCYIEAGSRIWFISLQSKFILQPHPRPDTEDVGEHERASDKNSFLDCYPPTQWVTDTPSQTRPFPPQARSADIAFTAAIPHLPSPMTFFHWHCCNDNTAGDLHLFNILWFPQLIFWGVFYLFICLILPNIDQHSKTEYKQFMGCNWLFVTRKCF